MGLGWADEVVPRSSGAPLREAALGGVPDEMEKVVGYSIWGT